MSGRRRPASLAGREGATVQRRVLFEGWRFIHHSYALVAQAHCLCLLRRGDIELRFRDYPYYYQAWRRTRGILAPDDEHALALLPAPEPGFVPEASVSMRAEESDFAAPPSGRKFVFGTPEYRVLQGRQRGGLASGEELPPAVDIITPSGWCALAYQRFGVAPARIHVVPHGVDPAIVGPDPVRRAAARAALKLGAEERVFLSVGAMTPNKGIDLLLAAFARVAESEPEVRLLLKGADGLYPSRELVNVALNELPAAARETVIRHMIYTGGTYSSEKMADLTRAADVYVAPYRAEGFNLPVLEAAGCGVPVICTAGGPTDEFSDASFCRRIRSDPGHPDLSDGLSGDALSPDPEHLYTLMVDAAREGDAWRAMGQRGARHVRERYTWAAVTDRLVDVLFGAA